MSYFDSAFDINRFNATIKWIKRAVNEHFLLADCIAARGVSGVLPLMAICSKLKKYPWIIRKPTENAHSGNRINLPSENVSYIILDDFISTGAPVKAIIAEIEKYAESNEMPVPKCLGVVCYQSDSQWRNLPAGFTMKVCVRDGSNNLRVLNECKTA